MKKTRKTLSEHAEELEAKKTRSKCYMSGIANAAISINELSHNKLDLVTVFDSLEHSINEVQQGSPGEMEKILISQAKTLDVLFHKSIRQIIHTDMINQIQAYSDIALRAQTQCRKTLLALAEIRHPKRTTFISQQNNAINQQVNNQPSENPQKNSANELLENLHGNRLDTRAQTTAVTADPAMATLEPILRG